MQQQITLSANSSLYVALAQSITHLSAPANARFAVFAHHSFRE